MAQRKYHILSLVDSVDREYYIFDRTAPWALAIVEGAGTLKEAKQIRDRLNAGLEARPPKRQRKRRGRK